MKKIVLIALLLLTACSGASPSPAPVDESEVYQGLGREALGPHHATYLLRYESGSSWTYRLDIRHDGEATEYSLHIEGLPPSQNPGDVRLVTAGGVSTMRGPGTEDTCVRFPDELSLGPVFLTPDDLLPPNQLAGALTRVGSGTVAGRAATHYRMAVDGPEGWQDVQVEVWRDETNDATLRYDLQAQAPDPLFDTGSGSLTARYVVNEVGPQQIEPIAGCEIELPIPEEGMGVVKLPGLVAFEIAATREAMVDFYQSGLASAGWQPAADPLAGAGATVLSYAREGELLEVHIEESGRGVTVELHTDVQPTGP